MGFLKHLILKVQSMIPAFESSDLIYFATVY